MSTVPHLTASYRDYWQRATSRKSSLICALETKEPILIRSLLGYETTPWFENTGLRINEEFPDTEIIRDAVGVEVEEIKAYRSEVIPPKKAAAGKKKGKKTKTKKKETQLPKPTPLELAKIIGDPTIYRVVKNEEAIQREIKDAKAKELLSEKKERLLKKKEQKAQLKIVSNAESVEQIAGGEGGDLPSELAVKIDDAENSTERGGQLLVPDAEVEEGLGSSRPPSSDAGD